MTTVHTPDTALEGETVDLPLDHLPGSDAAPRDEAYKALRARVRASGVQQAILVTPSPDGGFDVLDGRRRVQAARDCGFTVIPARIQERPSDAGRRAAPAIRPIEPSPAPGAGSLRVTPPATSTAEVVTPPSAGDVGDCSPSPGHLAAATTGEPPPGSAVDERVDMQTANDAVELAGDDDDENSEPPTPPVDAVVHSHPPGLLTNVSATSRPRRRRVPRSHRLPKRVSPPAAGVSAPPPQTAAFVGGPGPEAGLDGLPTDAAPTEPHAAETECSPWAAGACASLDDDEAWGTPSTPDPGDDALDDEELGLPDTTEPSSPHPMTGGAAPPQAPRGWSIRERAPGDSRAGLAGRGATRLSHVAALDAESRDTLFTAPPTDAVAIGELVGDRCHMEAEPAAVRRLAALDGAIEHSGGAAPPLLTPSEPAASPPAEPPKPVAPSSGQASDDLSSTEPGQASDDLSSTEPGQASDDVSSTEPGQARRAPGPRGRIRRPRPLDLVIPCSMVLGVIAAMLSTAQVVITSDPQAASPALVVVSLVGFVGAVVALAMERVAAARH